MPDRPARDVLGKAMDAADLIEAQGTPTHDYGPPYKEPWYIVDTSTAEPEVNWPGGFVASTSDTAKVRALLREARLDRIIARLAEAGYRIVKGD